mmetsp:Transcript_11127/g.28955  ORF Transcript_11127/g.28955 Transcript_11127/m.28955 type:complete len:261 (+) Transcript_11127:220-1002(+)
MRRQCIQNDGRGPAEVKYLKAFYWKSLGRRPNCSGSSEVVSPTLISSFLPTPSMAVNHMERPPGCSSCMKMPSQSSANGHLAPLLDQVRGKATELLSTASAADCALNSPLSCCRKAGMHCASVSGESNARAAWKTPRGAASPDFLRCLAASFPPVLSDGCMYTRGSSVPFSSRSPSVVRMISVANSSGARSVSALRLPSGRGAGMAGGALPVGGCVDCAGAPAGAPTIAAAAGAVLAAARALRMAATSATNCLPRSVTPS